ncbi:MAG TPA: hypothetical protein GXZ48_01570 [Acholeplasmataceae bacterium]|nr:hypothetical protein [Acholeplasmataceae bacterium]
MNNKNVNNDREILKRRLIGDSKAQLLALRKQQAEELAALKGDNLTVVSGLDELKKTLLVDDIDSSKDPQMETPASEESGKNIKSENIALETEKAIDIQDIEVHDEKKEESKPKSETIKPEIIEEEPLEEVKEENKVEEKVKENLKKKKEEAPKDEEKPKEEVKKEETQEEVKEAKPKTTTTKKKTTTTKKSTSTKKTTTKKTTTKKSSSTTKKKTSSAATKTKTTEDTKIRGEEESVKTDIVSDMDNKDLTSKKNIEDPRTFFETKLKPTISKIEEEDERSRGIINNLQKLREQIMIQKRLEREMMESEAQLMQKKELEIQKKLSDLEILIKDDDDFGYEDDEEVRRLTNELEDTKQKLNNLLSITYNNIPVFDTTTLALSDNFIKAIANSNDEEINQELLNIQQEFLELRQDQEKNRQSLILSHNQEKIRMLNDIKTLELKLKDVERENEKLKDKLSKVENVDPKEIERKHQEEINTIHYKYRDEIKKLTEQYEIKLNEQTSNKGLVEEYLNKLKLEREKHNQEVTVLKRELEKAKYLNFAQKQVIKDNEDRYHKQLEELKAQLDLQQKQFQEYKENVAKEKNEKILILQDEVKRQKEIIQTYKTKVEAEAENKIALLIKQFNDEKQKLIDSNYQKQDKLKLELEKMQDKVSGLENLLEDYKYELEKLTQRVRTYKEQLLEERNNHYEIEQKLFNDLDYKEQEIMRLKQKLELYKTEGQHFGPYTPQYEQPKKYYQPYNIHLDPLKSYYEQEIARRDHIISSLQKPEKTQEEQEFENKIASLESQIKDLGSYIKSINQEQTTETKSNTLNDLIVDLEKFKEEIRQELVKQKEEPTEQKLEVKEVISEREDEKEEITYQEPKEFFQDEIEEEPIEEERLIEAIEDEEKIETEVKEEKPREQIEINLRRATQESTSFVGKVDQEFLNKLNNIRRLQQVLEERKNEYIFNYNDEIKQNKELQQEHQTKVDEVQVRINDLNRNYYETQDFSNEAKNEYEKEKTRLYLELQARQENLRKVQIDDLRKIKLRHQNEIENIDAQLESLREEEKRLKDQYLLRQQKIESKQKRENEILMKLEQEQMQEQTQEEMQSEVGRVIESQEEIKQRKFQQDLYREKEETLKEELEQDEAVDEEPLKEETVKEEADMTQEEEATEEVMEPIVTEKTEPASYQQSFGFEEEEKPKKQSEKLRTKELELRELFERYSNAEKKLCEDFNDVRTYKAIKNEKTGYDIEYEKQQELLVELKRKLDSETDSEQVIKLKDEIKTTNLKINNLKTRIAYLKRQMDSLEKNKQVEHYKAITERLNTMKNILKKYADLREKAIES